MNESFVKCFVLLSHLHWCKKGRVLEEIRFRGPVVPGNRLLIMLAKGKVRRNRMFTAKFQGFVDQSLVVDGIIRGVALGE